MARECIEGNFPLNYVRRNGAFLVSDLDLDQDGCVPGAPLAVLDWSSVTHQR